MIIENFYSLNLSNLNVEKEFMIDNYRIITLLDKTKIFYVWLYIKTENIF